MGERSASNLISAKRHHRDHYQWRMSVESETADRLRSCYAGANTFRNNNIASQNCNELINCIALLSDADLCSINRGHRI